MFLHQFEVTGYKNLSQKITFGPLGRINVIHGPNNVGKSNLLQAMDLFFKILGNLFKLNLYHATINPRKVGSNQFTYWGFNPTEIFNLVKPLPIKLDGIFSFTDTELTDYDINKNLGNVKITFTISPFSQDNVKLTAAYDITNSQMKEFVTSSYFGENKGFGLLGLNRHYTTTDNSQIVPQQLRDELFDAKEAWGTDLVKRWELFVETMKAFEDIFGPSEFSTAFDRPNNKADLVLDKDYVRIPVDLLGSGIQQLVALLGQLILTPAALIGIEEPELNLRYSLQKRLLKAFKKITESDYGPQQIFLSSHSTAFEAEETFFAMEMKDGIPTVTPKPREMAWMYTGVGKGEEDKYAEMYAKFPASVNYVSSEGLVLLPEQLRKKLNLQQGGISFIPNDETGRFELWTTDELDEWFSGADSNDNEG